MSRQHQGFLRRLKASRPVVHHVAEWLRARGHDVVEPEPSFAPTAADAAKHVDEGDLFADGRRIEVKGLSMKFTGRRDWPYREMFVSNKGAVERAGDHPVAYISVSSDWCFGAIIKQSSNRFWYISEKLVQNTGNIEKNYACPLEHVAFFAIPHYRGKHFLHACHCGKWGAFGYGYGGKAVGDWSCSEHRGDRLAVIWD